MATFWTLSTSLFRFAAPNANDVGNDIGGGQMIQAMLDSHTRGVTLTSADSPYTVPVNVSRILCNCTGGAISLTLPAVGTTGGLSYWIKKTDSTANAVTISPNIDGLAKSLTMQYQVEWCICDNAAYQEIL